MRSYNYTAIDSNGNEIEGTCMAESVSEVIHQIMDTRPSGVRYFPVEIKPTTPQKEPDSYCGFIPRKLPVTQQQLANTAHILSILVGNGTPIVRAIRSAASDEHNPYLKAALNDVEKHIVEGGTLHEAISRHPKIFDNFFVNMIKAGEIGGELPTFLSLLSIYIDRWCEDRAVKHSAILVTILAPAGPAIFAANILGFPFSVVTIIVSIAAIFAVIFLFRRLSGTPMTSLPVIDKAESFRNISIFASTVGTLMGSGVPALQALKITKQTCRNKLFEGAVQDIHDYVKDWGSFDCGMTESGLFPIHIVAAVVVGEETGVLPETFKKIGEDCTAEADAIMWLVTKALWVIITVSALFLGLTLLLN